MHGTGAYILQRLEMIASFDITIPFYFFVELIQNITIMYTSMYLNMDVLCFLLHTSRIRI